MELTHLTFRYKEIISVVVKKDVNNYVIYERNLHFSAADNSRFASAGGDKMVYLWDVGTGKTIRKWYGHQQVGSVKFLFHVFLMIRHRNSPLTISYFCF